MVSEFIEQAKEVEIDAVAQEGEVKAYAISEHVEFAGVHSGDATIVFPAQKLYVETIRRIKKIARSIAKELNISGPFNMQFLAKDNDIKVIECNLRASRSFPFVSKVLKYNFIDMATRIMLGEKVESLNKSVFDLDYVGVKASQFSFARLLKADPVLGVDMASTGEVGCIGENYYEAILKSMLSVGHRIPKKDILISSLRKELENYIYHKEQKLGYSHVYTPCVGTVDLYKTSGHWDHYKENMFPSMKVDDEEFVLRPMNCPHHMLIYGNTIHSYRELPIKIGEFATDFRYEASGAVKGLERVRCMCQNDAHLFVRPDQIKQEFKEVVGLILDVYKDFGLKNYTFRLSLRDPEDKHKYFDDDEMWNNAENELREVLNEIGVPYHEAIGEAAFYGPKLDVEVKPAVGPEVTLSTCQLDFLLPRRFNLSYIDNNGEKKVPVVLHRAIFGTFDRFTAFILEETKGALPLWLSPVQINIIPVNNEYHLEYATNLLNKLRDKEFRVELDSRDEKMGYKIREAQTKKIPYTLVLGNNERDNNTITYRKYGEESTTTMSTEEFITMIEEQIKEYK